MTFSKSNHKEKHTFTLGGRILNNINVNVNNT